MLNGEIRPYFNAIGLFSLVDVPRVNQKGMPEVFFAGGMQGVCLAILTHVTVDLTFLNAPISTLAR